MFEIFVKNYQTWVVCGGRDFADAGMFNNAMIDLVRLRGMPNKIVHGAAKGADAMADQWARRFGLALAAVPADWDSFGKQAGPIRNQIMLDDHAPDLVVAFPGGNGTADMVRRARKIGVDVAEIRSGPPPLYRLQQTVC